MVKYLLQSTPDGIETSKSVITLKTLVIAILCSVENRCQHCVTPRFFAVTTDIDSVERFGLGVDPGRLAKEIGDGYRES